MHVRDIVVKNAMLKFNSESSELNKFRKMIGQKNFILQSLFIHNIVPASPFKAQAFTWISLIMFSIRTLPNKTFCTDLFLDSVLCTYNGQDFSQRSMLIVFTMRK